MKKDYSGYWTGEINGTNNGGITLNIKQTGNSITGTAKIHEPALGQYEYKIEGTINEMLSFRLTPVCRGGLMLGVVQAICTLDSDDSLAGQWKSEIGTEGVFTAKKFKNKSLTSELPKSNSVFIVHGHDGEVKQSVARFLEQINIKPVILQEQLNQGMTILEKFEDFASRAGFAVILITPDDFGYPTGEEEKKKHRPRQNVILEMGYFFAKLGRNKMMVLIKGDVEVPSDIFGLAYEQIDRNDGWKMRLARELKAAEFPIDMNKII